jgi:type II secretory pathway pseudopilin PulG
MVTAPVVGFVLAVLALCAVVLAPRWARRVRAQRRRERAQERRAQLRRAHELRAQRRRGAR